MVVVKLADVVVPSVVASVLVDIVVALDVVDAGTEVEEDPE